MIRDKKAAAYALAMLVLLGGALMAFIFAATEQSIISSGRPEANTALFAILFKRRRT